MSARMAITIHVFDEQGHRLHEGPADIPALVAQPNTVLWIDTDESSAAVADLMQVALKMHALVVEDVFSNCMQPKIEEYPDYLYLVMHGVRRDADSPDNLNTVELDIVLGANWIFTHHEIPLRSIEGLSAELKRNPRALQKGPAFVAHGVLDRLTEHYLPVVDKFEEEIDIIEQQVIDNPTPVLLSKIFTLKRSLQSLRRISVYQRDTLQRLARGEFELIPEKALPFFRDVYDHFVRIADLADSYRELVSASLDIYMSVVANRTNEVMKTLALISTIMLPLTFIAGLYGMNFKFMPELQWRYGYPMALGLMSLVALLFSVHFYRKKWF
jgi:magnesium transporter